MINSASPANKEFVLKAFDTLFNKRDYKMAEAFWSPDYIQHSAHIPQGREGLFDLIKGLPPSLKYENDVVMAEDDLVMLHGRFSGIYLLAACDACRHRLAPAVPTSKSSRNGRDRDIDRRCRRFFTLSPTTRQGFYFAVTAIWQQSTWASVRPRAAARSVKRRRVED
jgi:SnoaL-like domain